MRQNLLIGALALMLFGCAAIGGSPAPPSVDVSGKVGRDLVVS